MISIIRNAIWYLLMVKNHYDLFAKISFTVVFGALSELGVHMLSQTVQFVMLTILLFLDYIFGLIAAIKHGDLTWSLAFQGIWSIAGCNIIFGCVIGLEYAFPIVSWLSEVVVITTIPLAVMSMVYNSASAGVLKKNWSETILRSIKANRNFTGILSGISGDKDKTKVSNP